ncbi:MAG: squalene/phytoene synthase family protein [Anaerolineales bacterium]|nr:squalene/phytoene synthase family protein [Anaerolineales bacterium]
MHFDQYALLRATSRTFALSIEQLPQPIRDAICIAYLMMRVSDFLEDNEYMPPERKVRLLRLWEQIVAGKAAPEQLVAELSDRAPEDADAEAARQAPALIAALRRLPPALQNHIALHVRDTARGMARWVLRGPDVPEEHDLDDYMHEVAGRVGYLVTEVFAWYSGFVRARKDVLMPLAREFGLALQTVNVIRGLRKDYERGWIYVPESFCAAVNLHRTDLFDPAYQRQALEVLDKLADKAERHLQGALAYVKQLPRWLHALRLACIWPLLFAVRTLAISRRNVNVLMGEVKMTREEVTAIVRHSTLLGWSNHWLDYYYRRLRTPPPVEAPLVVASKSPT